MDGVYAMRLTEREKPQTLGYHIISIWECAWTRQKTSRPLLSFLEVKRLPSPLNPCDAFFGGQANAYRLYYRVQPNEKVRYYDYRSLYPWVKKYCTYPIRPPVVITRSWSSIRCFIFLNSDKGCSALTSTHGWNSKRKPVGGHHGLPPPSFKSNIVQTFFTKRVSF